ncbi:protein-L-isoaspartate O-methyltransferase [Sphingobium sp. H39-3-25]|uniref:protein-L-isoaspartate O-methyltransferase family protein n=1 Tax=Sphingobium arseniciresistens TaxID=3030834 RepID=UPI0023BA0201|nr:protein-L-isoaspartate O-methyltransferase [Sphingobium arseniciresistens]
MTDQNYSSMRNAMVESQLRTSDVNDTRVIAAMAKVPREDFLPAERRAMAYIDRPVPVSAERSVNPPLATGRLLNEVLVKPGEKVLLVGAATGYCAALLKALGGSVTALEEDAALADIARGNGVEVTQGALAAGAADAAPYDVILIDGAVEEVPQALLGQLAEGGRIATGLFERGVTRLCFGRKTGGSFGLNRLVDMEMVVLPGFARPRSFAF